MDLTSQVTPDYQNQVQFPPSIHRHILHFANLPKVPVFTVIRTYLQETGCVSFLLTIIGKMSLLLDHLVSLLQYDSCLTWSDCLVSVSDHIMKAVCGKFYSHNPWQCCYTDSELIKDEAISTSGSVLVGYSFSNSSYYTVIVVSISMKWIVFNQDESRSISSIHG